MRVLLTGAGGFIGSNVAQQLAARGDDVTAVVSPRNTRDRLRDVALSRIVEADLASADLDALVRSSRPELCMHLAWYVEPRRYLCAVAENLVSLAAGARLLAALDSGGCRRVLLAGTCLEPGTLVDGRPAAATTPYAAAKAALHSVSQHLERTEVACAHIFNLYGPGERPERVVPTVVRACLRGEPVDVTDGTQVRDYLHVEDVAAALVSVARSPARGRIDICAGYAVRLQEVFAAVGQATGRPELIRLGSRARTAGEPDVVVGDPAPVTAIGWSPRWTLDAGIAQTVGWWRREIDRERSSR